MATAQVSGHNRVSECDESDHVACLCPAEPWGEGVCCAGAPGGWSLPSAQPGTGHRSPRPGRSPPNLGRAAAGSAGSSWLPEATSLAPRPSRVASAPSGSPLDGGTGSWTPVCTFRAASRPRQWGSGLCTPRGAPQAPGASAGEHLPLPVTKAFSQSPASSSTAFPVFGTQRPLASLHPGCQETRPLSLAVPPSPVARIPWRRCYRGFSGPRGVRGGPGRASVPAVAPGSGRLRERVLCGWGSGKEAPVLGRVPWRGRGGFQRQLAIE